MVGLPPFFNKDIQQIYQDIINKEVEFPSNIKLSNQLMDLIKGLLHKDPSVRLGKNGIEEILSNPWFAQISLKDVANKKINPPFIPNLLQLNCD